MKLTFDGKDDNVTVGPALRFPRALTPDEVAEVTEALAVIKRLGGQWEPVVWGAQPFDPVTYWKGVWRWEQRGKAKE